MVFGEMQLNILATLAVAALLLGAADAQLKIGFYKDSCPNAEQIVRDETKVILGEAASLAGAFLRMVFHDCFVRGCDASVLLNSRKGTGEKDAIPSVRGFDAVERIKSKLEETCPGVVSCADLLILVARDSVHITGGPDAFYEVETGRRDGNVSIGQEAIEKLPDPNFNFAQLVANFAKFGLNTKDMVVLSGGHTIGIASCKSFASSLYNFTADGGADPSIDKQFVPHLRRRCPNPDAKSLVELDPGSFRTFDTSFYKLIAKRRGVLRSDRALMEDPVGAAYVQKAAAATSPVEFFRDFAESMQKMGRINVLTGTQGTVRKVCGAWVD